MTQQLAAKSLSPKRSKRCTNRLSGVAPATPESIALNLAKCKRTNEQLWSVVLANRGLAVSIARPAAIGDYSRLGDFIHEGLIGIYNAAVTYNPPYIKHTFRRLASKSVQHAIWKALIKDELIPIKETTRRRSKDPTYSTPAVEDARKALDLTRVYSLDIAETNPGRVPADEIEALSNALLKLRGNERYVIQQYYLNGVSSEKIAVALNLVPHTIRRMRREALGKLKSWLTNGE